MRITSHILLLLLAASTQAKRDKHITMNNVIEGDGNISGNTIVAESDTKPVGGEVSGEEVGPEHVGRPELLPEEPVVPSPRQRAAMNALPHKLSVRPDLPESGVSAQPMMQVQQESHGPPSAPFQPVSTRVMHQGNSGPPIFMAPEMQRPPVF